MHAIFPLDVAMRDDEKINSIIQRRRRGLSIGVVVFSIAMALSLAVVIEKFDKDIIWFLVWGIALVIGVRALNLWKVELGALPSQMEETLAKLRALQPPPPFDGKYSDARGYSIRGGKGTWLFLLDQNLERISSEHLPRFAEEPIVKWAEMHLINLPLAYVL